MWWKGPTPHDRVSVWWKGPTPHDRVSVWWKGPTSVWWKGPTPHDRVSVWWKGPTPHDNTNIERITCRAAISYSVFGKMTNNLIAALVTQTVD